MQQERIYLLFSDTGTLLSGAIKHVTKQPYNHVSLSFDRELKNVYSFGRKTPYNPLRGGFVRERVDLYPFQHARCAIYSLPVTSFQKEKMKRMVRSFEQNNQRYHYNFLGLWTAFKKIEWEREDHYFCSQFVSNVLAQGEVCQFDQPFCFIAPHDLQALPSLNLEYEGALQSYIGNTNRLAFI